MYKYLNTKAIMECDETELPFPYMKYTEEGGCWALIPTREAAEEYQCDAEGVWVGPYWGVEDIKRIAGVVEATEEEVKELERMDYPNAKEESWEDRQEWYRIGEIANKLLIQRIDILIGDLGDEDFGLSPECQSSVLERIKLWRDTHESP